MEGLCRAFQLLLAQDDVVVFAMISMRQPVVEAEVGVAALRATREVD